MNVLAYIGPGECFRIAFGVGFLLLLVLFVAPLLVAIVLSRRAVRQADSFSNRAEDDPGAR